MSYKRTFKDPILDNNPITSQVLGICSALAVTSQLKPSLFMGVSVIIIVTLSNIIVSSIRDSIPRNVRIIVEMTVIASLVILTDQILKAYFFDVSKQLSVYIGLIITNCIILGRLEGFALSNKVSDSLFDGLGNGVGYAAILVAVGAFRELLGSGKLMGIQIVPDSFYAAGYTDNSLFVLAPGAFFVLGLIIWLQRAVTENYEEE